MHRRTMLAACAVAMTIATSCTFGEARRIDVTRDLSGLDLVYLQREAKPAFDENTQSIEGQLAGVPFWFAPVATVGFRGTNARHLGPVEDADNPVSPITGYDHVDGSALGMGLVHYRTDSAVWDASGVRQDWRSGWGLGAGLLYSSERSGEGPRQTAMSTKLLAGLFGYSERPEGSYLHLLWIPIGVGGPTEHDD